MCTSLIVFFSLPQSFWPDHRNQALRQFPFLNFDPFFYLVLQTHQGRLGQGSGCAVISSAQGPLTAARDHPIDGGEMSINNH